jgi:hypothetical protein
MKKMKTKAPAGFTSLINSGKLAIFAFANILINNTNTSILNLTIISSWKSKRFTILIIELKLVLVHYNPETGWFKKIHSSSQEKISY